jgi:hypothetical protein
MRLLRVIALVAVCLTLSIASRAQSVAGNWSGLIQGEGLHIVFHISGNPGSYTATADSPDQHAAGIPATVSASGRAVTISIPVSSPFSFTGNVSGSTISGKWSQNGQSGVLILTRQGGGNGGARAGTGIAGTWSGVIQGEGLHIVFHISGNPGSYTATADSPDQHAAGIPATVSASGSVVTISIPVSSPFAFTGNVSGSTISGKWSQGGQSGSLTLTKNGA